MGDAILTSAAGLASRPSGVLPIERRTGGPSTKALRAGQPAAQPRLIIDAAHDAAKHFPGDAPERLAQAASETWGPACGPGPDSTDSASAVPGHEFPGRPGVCRKTRTGLNSDRAPPARHLPRAGGDGSALRRRSIGVVFWESEKTTTKSEEDAVLNARADCLRASRTCNGPEHNACGLGHLRATPRLRGVFCLKRSSRMWTVWNRDTIRPRVPVEARPFCRTRGDAHVAGRPTPRGVTLLCRRRCSWYRNGLCMCRATR